MNQIEQEKSILRLQKLTVAIGGAIELLAKDYIERKRVNMVGFLDESSDPMIMEKYLKMVTEDINILIKEL